MNLAGGIPREGTLGLNAAEIRPTSTNPYRAPNGSMGPKGVPEGTADCLHSTIMTPVEISRSYTSTAIQSCWHQHCKSGMGRAWYRNHAGRHHRDRPLGGVMSMSSDYKEESREGQECVQVSHLSTLSILR